MKRIALLFVCCLCFGAGISVAPVAVFQSPADTEVAVALRQFSATQSANLLETQSADGTGAWASITGAKEFSNSRGVANSESYGRAAELRNNPTESFVAGPGAIVDTSVKSVALGPLAIVGPSGERSIAIGWSPFTFGRECIAIGPQARAETTYATVVGAQSTGGNEAAIVGAFNYGKSIGSFIFGYHCTNHDDNNGALLAGDNVNARLGGSGAIGLGSGMNIGHVHCTVIGRSNELNNTTNIVTTRDYQCILGLGDATYQFGGGIQDFCIGNGTKSAAPVPVRIHTTDGFGTNIEAKDLTVQPGRGSGSAKGGDFIVEVSPGGAGGAQVNPALETLRVKTDGSVILGRPQQGLVYIPAHNGPPTQSPPERAGYVAMYFDGTGNCLYVHSNGQWIRFGS